MPLAKLKSHIRPRFKRPPPSIIELRIRDLSRLREARYGLAMPDNADTRRLAFIIAQHLASMPGTDPFRTIPSWLALYAPWCTKAETAHIITDAIDQPKFWKAQELGWALKLNAADRKAARITTIGAFDMSPQQRAKQRKEMRRLAMIEKRRLNGAKPRQAYLAEQAAKPKPWLSLGISRATYYRRVRLGP